MTNKHMITLEEWLGNDKLSILIWNTKYKYKDESFEQWLDRVSDGNEEIKKLIIEKKFIFGGRTLSNRGTKSGSYSNCYSIGHVPDNLDGILDVNSKIAKTYKYQGGQGLDLSKIRPKGASINGEYTSDGIEPFMEMFNTTTQSISQGGARKGALMMSINAWHPESELFINIKNNRDRINKANLSVLFDDDFMDQIKNNDDSEVEFNELYGNYPYQYNIKPVTLWKQFCKNARDHAEPGALFENRLKSYNFMQYVSDYEIETTNPCGEQPLPKHGACNLGSINLSAYVTDPYTKYSKFNYDEFFKDIPLIVRAMDDVLEENISRHPLKEQQEMARKYRNIGIGIMGIADMFVMLGLKYGSRDSILLIDKIAHFLLRKSIIASARLANERGNFPGYDPLVWSSDIMKQAFDKTELEMLMSTNKLRNCSLLSVAPTGSIGTMLGVSTGVEPFFQISYTRKTESIQGKDMYHEVHINALRDYQKINNTTDIPDYFICSSDINWKDRIKMQSTIQNYVDTAISSTINLPSTTTYEEIEELYLNAWESGLKGVTIYVEGTRDPILSKHTPDPIKLNYVKRPKSLDADIYSLRNKGEGWIIVIGKYEGHPYEVFAFKSDEKLKDSNGVIIKEGKMKYRFKSVNHDFNFKELMTYEEKSATLYISMLLRHGAEIKYIIKTAKEANDNVASFTGAICRILSKYDEITTSEKCPKCGGKLKMEGGCTECMECGWSKCG